MFFLVQNLNKCNTLSDDRYNTIDCSFQALLFVCMNVQGNEICAVLGC